MTQNSLHELYINELRDLYNAENQLVKALPKMAKSASSQELQQAFQQHLEQTKGQVERLEQVFEILGKKAQGKKCLGMEGLIKEGAEIMKEDFEDAVMDAALISAAQRVEHYEIASYGTLRDFAEVMGHNDQSSLLQQTLDEEKETDRKLTELAKNTNVEAFRQGEEKKAQAEEQAEIRSRRGTRRAA